METARESAILNEFVQVAGLAEMPAGRGEDRVRLPPGQGLIQSGRTERRHERREPLVARGDLHDVLIGGLFCWRLRGAAAGKDARRQ